MPNLGRACLRDAVSVDVGPDPLALLGAGDGPGGSLDSGATGGRTGSGGKAVCVTGLFSRSP